MSFCNKSSKRHQTRLCATSDVQGVSTKAQGIYSCTASFWTGRTGNRAALQNCPCDIKHLPEWKVPAKWTAMFPLNIGSPRPQHKHKDLDATVFLGGGLFHSSSEGTTTVLLVICPCVNLTTTSLSAFLFVVCSSSNSQYVVILVCFKSVSILLPQSQDDGLCQFAHSKTPYKSLLIASALSGQCWCCGTLTAYRIRLFLLVCIRIRLILIPSTRRKRTTCSQRHFSTHNQVSYIKIQSFILMLQGLCLAQEFLALSFSAH